MPPLRIAVIGFGKIAADSHEPAIGANARLRLDAVVSRSGQGPEPRFDSVEALLEDGPPLDAAAITTPPGVRHAIARTCLEAGLHLMLEKPPATTLGEVDDLARLAAQKGLTLFTTWHAQHAASVDQAARILADRPVRSVKVTWHEDVRKWHPDQQWIWAPGGFGVFDPGINAFSILTRLFAGTWQVASADLHYEGESQTPIAAEIRLDCKSISDGARCSFDWRRAHGEEWTIQVELEDGGRIDLMDGGARLVVDGKEQPQPATVEGEYPALYRRFAELIDDGQSLVDVGPMRMVADCLLAGRQHRTG